MVAPRIPVSSAAEVSPDEENLLLSVLPAALRPNTHEGPFAKDMLVDCLHCLHTLDLKFDLRTKDGASALQTLPRYLGPHTSSVRSLSLRHWTCWWSYGDNSWTSCEDKTRFSRGTSGELLISRVAVAPLRDTCACSMSTLLSQHDISFSLERFRATNSIQQFVNALHSGVERPTLVDAAGVFASMLDGHSKLLCEEYGLAGNTRRGCCFAPRLYLCGRHSTRRGHGSDVVFDAKAYPRSSIASSNVAVVR